MFRKAAAPARISTLADLTRAYGLDAITDLTKTTGARLCRAKVTDVDRFHARTALWHEQAAASVLNSSDVCVKVFRGVGHAGHAHAVNEVAVVKRLEDLRASGVNCKHVVHYYAAQAGSGSELAFIIMELCVRPTQILALTGAALQAGPGGTASSAGTRRSRRRRDLSSRSICSACKNTVTARSKWRTH